MTGYGESDRRRILALDVCGTLYDANTTAGFCEYHHTRAGNHLRLALIRAISRRFSPLRVALMILGRILSRDIHRMVTIRSLAGLHADEIHASAAAYITALSERRIVPVWDLIADLRQQNPEIYLVSNAIDPVVSAIARDMNVNCVSSQLAWNGAICAGQLDVDTTGRKKACLEERLGILLQSVDFMVITDNKSDGDLLGAADRAVIVHRGKRRPWMTAHDEAEYIHHG